MENRPEYTLFGRLTYEFPSNLALSANPNVYLPLEQYNELLTIVHAHGRATSEVTEAYRPVRADAALVIGKPIIRVLFGAPSDAESRLREAMADYQRRVPEHFREEQFPLSATDQLVRKRLF